MRNKIMNICPQCRRERETVLIFREREGSKEERRQCEWCQRKYFGKDYLATDSWLK